MRIHPVVLCGGSGTRLWPLSRSAYPKQFLRLAGEHSMLQETIGRTTGLPEIAAPTIICNEEHRFLVAEQLRAIGVKPRALLLEPMGRNTAPAVAAAALSLTRDDPDALMLVLASDHVIRDRASFHRAIRLAAAAADTGLLTTFGIVPDAPETGYGYIQRGASVPRLESTFAIGKFVEKPDRPNAERMLASGDHYWNSGMFMLKASAFLEELQAHKPEVLAAVRKALEASREDLDFCRLDKAAFAESPSISIDYAVMEKTTRGAVIPAQMGWSDVGSWDALWEIQEKSADGNVTEGDVMTEGVRNTYIKAETRMVAALGVEDLVIVETADAVLVARRSWVEHRSTRRWLGRSGESRNAGVGQCPTHGGCFQRRGIQWRRPFVGRASLDAAMAWAQRRIQERGRRAVPDPRGLFQRRGIQWRGPSWVEHRSTRRWLGRSGESRNAGVGQCPTHGGCFQRRGIQWRGPSWVEHRSTRRWLGRSGESRNAGVGQCPTHGGCFSAEASSGEGPSWVEHRSTRRWLGRSGESRNAGVGQCPTHGGCFQRRGIQWRRPFVGRASLDAAMAWAQRRIQERGRRAKPDPRGLFPAPRNPVAKALRGSSIARRGDGLGAAANPGTRASGEARPTGGVSSADESSGEALRGSSTARRGDGLGAAANPGTRASGSARPTGVVSSAEESSGEGPSWVEHRSTRRWLGRLGESRNAGVGQCPTHGGCFQRRGIQWRGPSWVEHRSTRRWLGRLGESRNAGVGRRLFPTLKKSAPVIPTRKMRTTGPRLPDTSPITSRWTGALPPRHR
jgi:mannose-1-phosphate guanylyltransferase / mannose-6-phosphate isomerase